MDSEYYEISAHSAEMINKAMHAKHSIFVVGTSACRALETSTTADGFVKQGRGWTDKFIYPPHVFKVTQKLITNFHVPESTLLMLACALGETDYVMKAYKKALKDRYRFLSYGDAMLIV
jgi:S-adenosylmethionine:tRNA ribosyltransferase-isomerase